MSGYQADDEQAFNVLFARYENRLYKFFLRRLGDANMSDDLYQTTWLKVHRNRNPALSYALVIVRNSTLIRQPS